NIGQIVTYTIKLSNSGNMTGVTDVIDDYDESHITIVPGSISGGGVNNSPTTGKIKWTGVSVPPGINTVTLTYQGTVGGTFSGGSGSCNPGQFPVINTVSLSNGNGTSNTLCVNGFANITSTKSASPNPANGGQVVTYTIKLSNSGNIAGTTDVVDDYDETHITIDPTSMSNGGVNNSPSTGIIKWKGISVTPWADTVVITYNWSSDASVTW